MTQSTFILESNNGKQLYAFGAIDFICENSENKNLERLQEFIDKHENQYIFLTLSYDLKNEIEKLESANKNLLDFPKIYAVVPNCVVEINKEDLNVLTGDLSTEMLDFINYYHSNDEPFPRQIHFKPQISKSEYFTKVSDLKHHLQRGDIYEINFCHQFLAKSDNSWSWMNQFKLLNEKTQAPFASLVKFNNFEILCGSPERFLEKRGRILRSQPIKGTAKRGKTPEEDAVLKQLLQKSKKEKAENVMIVDLVRNDFSRIALPNSVQVPELLKIYTFETVHQMISTVTCNVHKDLSFTDILRATFPMGSMTGAPKINAMKLSETHEDFQRGIYSGSIGYIDPNGDFDLNVVIRSLVHNTATKVVSCAVGGAITILSDAEEEYEECLTKVGKIINIQA